MSTQNSLLRRVKVYGQKRARTIILKCLTANISNTHIYLRGQFGYIDDNILLISEYVFKNNKVIQRYGDNIRWISGCILSTKSKKTTYFGFLIVGNEYEVIQK